MTVPQLMERYFPTKLQPKVSEEAFRMPKTIAGAGGGHQGGEVQRVQREGRAASGLRQV